MNPYTFKVIGTVDGATEPAIHADAGPDHTVLVGTEVVLDGTGSHDTKTSSLGAQGAGIHPTALTEYRWTFKILGYENNSPIWAFPERAAAARRATRFDAATACFVARSGGGRTR